MLDGNQGRVDRLASLLGLLKGGSRAAYRAYSWERKRLPVTMGRVGVQFARSGDSGATADWVGAGAGLGCGSLEIALGST